MNDYNLGLLSGGAGRERSDCPYQSDHSGFGDWMDGWKLGFHRLYNS